MVQAKNNTPSKLSTRYFPPNRWQVKGSTYYVPRPRRKVRVLAIYFILALIGLGLLTYSVIFLIIWWLG
jgi:hypothetical protein